MAKVMKYDIIIQCLGSKFPIAYSICMAFSERGSIIGRATHSTNLYDALGPVLIWEHLHIGASSVQTAMH